MDIREFSDLIEKYKRGKCSVREKELLEKYLESFQSNLGEWNENEMGNQKIIEDKIFAGLTKQVNKEKNNYINRTFFSSSLLKIAASIIIFVVLGTGILYISGVLQKKSGPVVWHEKVTSPGEKSVLTLSDGSKVILNADSKLRYTNQFNGATRVVYLKGEAYFEVHHNISKPFIVHTGNLTTTDLGTKFDVSAYPENKTITVSLLKGKVGVSRIKNGEPDQIAILKPKEQLLYDKEDNVSSLNTFDSLETIGWKDNIYKFENQPLSKVLPQLERAFGEKFILTDKPVLGQRITIEFKKDSLQTIVKVIKSLTGLYYKIIKGDNGKKEVLFSRSNK